MKTDEANSIRPRVRFATYVSEDTGDIVPLYLHTHDEIDGEIDGRIRRDSDHSRHEHTRAKFHAMLAAASAMGFVSYDTN